MAMKKIQNPWLHKEGYNCFGCAPDNASGLRMEFYEDGDEVVSVWHPQPQFQGWIDTLHGGIQAVLLDEICGWTVFRKLQTTGVTSRMETRYMKPVPTTGGHLTLRAHVKETRRNLATLEAGLYDEAGQLCTQAVCTYFTFPREKAAEMGFTDCRLEDEE